MGSMTKAQDCLREARRQVAAEHENLVYIDAQLDATGEEVFWGHIDTEAQITENMRAVLQDNIQSTLTRCYTVKFGQYMVNLKTQDEIIALLQASLKDYDAGNEYIVSLVPDTSRETDVLTSSVLSTTESEKQQKIEQRLPSAGIEEQLAEYFDAVTPEVKLDFSNFDLGLQSIGFGNKIEIVEAYMPENQITSLEDAIANVTGEVATASTYTVAAGDTLSGIATKFGLSMADLIAINANLENENSMIRPGDVVMVTVPERKLSVVYTNLEYSEGDYEAEVQYKDNNEWYTTKSEVIQQPVTGHRRVIAEVTYKNDNIQNTLVVKQETTREAVPKIIERGTQSPPTYIWPVSAGYTSSNFGGRKRPKAGASTYHQGVDIAVSTGTSVMASSGGTVTVAGWQSGYGYVVYIDHGNGVQTRYGHLSKILVSVGTRVYQGQVIARSGNTGNSTGPHLHFEYRINGTAYNPVGYVNN